MNLVRQAMPGSRIVVASAIPIGLDDVPSVHGDDAAGIALAVDHLVERGHRRIAHIGGGGGATAELRADSFVSALAARGLPPGGVGRSDFTERAGFRAANELLEAARPPSALVAANDLSALGALAAVRARGLAGRVAVTGYDNTYLAELGVAELTSIDPGNREIGRRAADLLARTEDDHHRHLIVPQLVIRASSDFFAPGD
jgi:DNA-binding LacI/PurR family transcriptional regulator